MKKPREWYRIQALADGLVADVNIYDEIGPSYCGEPTVSAQSFIDQLEALPDSVKTIRVHVNSPGGDVFDALTIANRLRAQREEKGRTVEMVVEGVAASAATIITSAGSPIRMADNALMMVHNPRSGGRGTAADMRKQADLLDRVRSSIIATYQWVSSKTTEELGAMLDAETWMDAAEAMANGFAHEIASGVQVTATLRESSVARLGEIPEALRPRVEALIARANSSGSQPAADIASLPAVQPEPVAITRDLLTAQAPELLTALLDEGKAAGRAEGAERAKAEALAAVRGEAQAAGAQAERERIRAIESGALPGHAALLVRAKYGADGDESKGVVAIAPMSPEAFALALIAEERGQRAQHLTDAAADSTEALSGIVPGTAPTASAGEEAKRQHLIKVGAQAGSTGRK